MKNRITAALTLISFLVFSWSCSSIREIKPEVLASTLAGSQKIQKLENKSGEVIEYPEKSPARVQKGSIVGAGKQTSSLELVEVESNGIEVLSRPGDPLMTVKTKNGRTIRSIKKIDAQGDKSVLHVLSPSYKPAPPSILLPDIARAWAKKSDPFLTVLLIAIPAGLVLIWLRSGSLWEGGLGGDLGKLK
jgi:hypothetical protein